MKTAIVTPAIHDPERLFGAERLASTRLLYYWAWQVCVAAFLLVVIEFLRRVTGPFHAYNREQFRVVRWCIGTNLSGVLLISIYARYQMWWRGLPKTLLADVLISLAPLVPAILAHLSGGSAHLIDAFNLGIGVFLLLKCAVLTSYVCQNATLRPEVRQSLYIFATTLIVLATFARWYNMSEVPQADEIHYTLLTYSLIHDHDFNLSNNYGERDYIEQFPSHIPGYWASASDMESIRREPHVVTTFKGQQLLWHDIGLPILLIPGYALAKRLGAQLTIAVIASLIPVAAVDIALLLGAGVIPSIIAAMVFTLTPPVYIFAQTVLAEVLGGAAIAWITLAFLKYRQHPADWRLLEAGIWFGLLPWICIRFWVLEFPLFLVIAAYIASQHRRAWLRLGSKLLFLGLPVVASLVVFAWFDHCHFNTYLPNAGYRILQTSMPQFWNRPYQGLLGLLFDVNYGLAPIAPLYVVGFAGVLLLLRRDRWSAAALILSFAGYVGFLSFSEYWWGGWSPGGRYLVSAIVFLVPAAALAFTPRSIWSIAPLALWTLAIDLIFMSDPHSRWPAYYDQSGLVHYLHQSAHFGGHLSLLLTIFPNLVRPAPRDYFDASCWAAASVFLAWWLARVASQQRPTSQSR
ncbi:MAG: hypothetical protein ACLPPV_10765 [Candidatus Korobacteraceae bacterium]|jgi:hypothetical protein